MKLCETYLLAVLTVTLLSKDSSWSRRNASFQLRDSVLAPAEVALLSHAKVGLTVFDLALPISDSQGLRIKLYRPWEGQRHPIPSSYSPTGDACMNSRHSLILEKAIIIQSNPIVLRQPCFAWIRHIRLPETRAVQSNLIIFSNQRPHDPAPFNQRYPTDRAVSFNTEALGIREWKSWIENR